MQNDAMSDLPARKNKRVKKKASKNDTYQMTPFGLQVAVREANTKATKPIQRLALILKAAIDEKRETLRQNKSPLNLLADKIKEQLQTELKKFDILEGVAQYKLFLLENLLLEQNF